MRSGGTASASRLDILVDRRWNAKERAFTLLKHGVIRTIALTDAARKWCSRWRQRRPLHRHPSLLRLVCFRYVLELYARDIAHHFGQQDGGELVRRLYGHPDARLARDRVREAFTQAPASPVPMRKAS
jgi:hypothetical protein